MYEDDAHLHVHQDMCLEPSHQTFITAHLLNHSASSPFAHRALKPLWQAIVQADDVEDGDDARSGCGHDNSDDARKITGCCTDQSKMRLPEHITAQVAVLVPEQASPPQSGTPGHSDDKSEAKRMSSTAGYDKDEVAERRPTTPTAEYSNIAAEIHENTLQPVKVEVTRECGRRPNSRDDSLAASDESASRAVIYDSGTGSVGQSGGVALVPVCCDGAMHSSGQVGLVDDWNLVSEDWMDVADTLLSVPSV